MTYMHVVWLIEINGADFVALATNKIAHLVC
jgi:hypothetical protein